MKILYISRMGVETVSLFEDMKEVFDVQVCNSAMDIVGSMIRLVKPDLIFVTQQDAYSENDYINILDGAGGIPIIVLCDKNDEIVNRCTAPNLKFLYMPLNNNQIIEMVKKIMETKTDSTCDTDMENANNQSARAAWDKKKILAVDDTALVLRNITSMLKDLYEVAVAPSVQAAIMQLKTKEFDLILLDYEMPEIDGVEALHKIRTELGLTDIPVVFLTSVSDKERIIKAMQYKPAGYLLKPIDAEQLRQTIFSILE